MAMQATSLPAMDGQLNKRVIDDGLGKMILAVHPERLPSTLFWCLGACGHDKGFQELNCRKNVKIWGSHCMARVVGCCF